MQAEDADRGQNGEVSYAIVSPVDNTFRIGRSDGRIVVGRDIDRESRSEKYIQVNIYI